MCVLNRTYQNVNITHTRRTQPRNYTSIYYKVVTCCVSVLHALLYHLGRFGFSPQTLNRYSNEPFFKCRHQKSLSLCSLLNTQSVHVDERTNKSKQHNNNNTDRMQHRSEEGKNRCDMISEACFSFEDRVCFPSKHCLCL